MLAQSHTKRAGRVYGYARVSTKCQSLRSQRDALKAASVDRIFEDKASGAQASRKGLDALLSILKPGDTVVVLRLNRIGRSVLNLAELLQHFNAHEIGFVSLTEGIDATTHSGKLVFNILSAVAEMEREIIAENTRIGLAAARKAGKRLGRPRAMNAAQVSEARRMMRDRRFTRVQIADQLGVSRMTLYRAVA